MNADVSHAPLPVAIAAQLAEEHGGVIMHACPRELLDEGYVDDGGRAYISAMVAVQTPRDEASAWEALAAAGFVLDVVWCYPRETWQWIWREHAARPVACACGSVSAAENADEKAWCLPCLRALLSA